MAIIIAVCESFAYTYRFDFIWYLLYKQYSPIIENLNPNHKDNNFLALQKLNGHDFFVQNNFLIE
jgi:hypothetical protein